MKRLVLLLACATLTVSACSGGSHDAGRAGSDAGHRTDVRRATTGIGAPGRRTVVVTPPREREVLGDLRVPALHHRTTIVLVHGGGGFLGDRGEVHAWQELYARSGYITLSADYFIFNDDTPPPVYPQPESDVKAAVQYLRRHADDLGVDPQRIVVHGFSAGARIGAQLLVGPDDPALAGPTRWPSPTDRIAGFIGFYGYYSGYQFQPDRYYGGRATSKDPEVRARWDAANSDARAATATGPVLLFHGDIDPMPLSQSTGFVDALRAAGHDADLEVVPGGNHGFDIKNGKLTPVGRLSGQRVLKWLEEHFA
ncbi:MAG TPA: alpha/beta hydrolase fold domain-containing protein [Acidimicrobiia bacterium]|nr:alpha/beta hydrolase fold domain-containing protein [Acidimicrobiia bacterium]